MRKVGNVAFVALLLAAVIAVLGVGAGAASANQQSSKTHVCAYAKQVGSAGNVYIALGVRPKSVGKTYCKAFNSGFKGKQVATNRRLGTGKYYCRYAYKKNSLAVVMVVFADEGKTGKAFCKVYHPKGWKKF